MDIATAARPSQTSLTPRTARRLSQAALRLFSKLSARRRQRIALADLDAHLLRDIGRTRREAMEEARKPFWR